MTDKVKRGYSREFPVTGKAVTYLLDPIPSGFWLKVRAKARRKGLSMRGLILGLLKVWVEQED